MSIICSAWEELSSSTTLFIASLWQVENPTFCILDSGSVWEHLLWRQWVRTNPKILRLLVGHGERARWGVVETASRAARDQSIIAPVALYWLWGPTGPQRSMCFQALCVSRWRSVPGLRLTFVCAHLCNTMSFYELLWQIFTCVSL